MATIRGDKNWFFRDDELIGTANADWVYRLDGKDVLFGRNGSDRLYGGNHDDRLYGEDGRDTLRGEWGNDRLYGGVENDTFIDTNGADLMSGGTAVDTIEYCGFYGRVAVDLTQGNAVQRETI